MFVVIPHFFSNYCHKQDAKDDSKEFENFKHVFNRYVSDKDIASLELVSTKSDKIINFEADFHDGSKSVFDPANRSQLDFMSTNEKNMPLLPIFNLTNAQSIKIRTIPFPLVCSVNCQEMVWKQLKLDPRLCNNLIQDCDLSGVERFTISDVQRLTTPPVAPNDEKKDEQGDSEQNKQKTPEIVYNEQDSIINENNNNNSNDNNNNVVSNVNVSYDYDYPKDEMFKLIGEKFTGIKKLHINGPEYDTLEIIKHIAPTVVSNNGQVHWTIPSPFDITKELKNKHRNFLNCFIENGINIKYLNIKAHGTAMRDLYTDIFSVSNVRNFIEILDVDVMHFLFPPTNSMYMMVDVLHKALGTKYVMDDDDDSGWHIFDSDDDSDDSDDNDNKQTEEVLINKTIANESETTIARAFERLQYVKSSMAIYTTSNYGFLCGFIKMNWGSMASTIFHNMNVNINWNEEFDGDEKRCQRRVKKILETIKTCFIDEKIPVSFQLHLQYLSISHFAMDAADRVANMKSRMNAFCEPFVEKIFDSINSEYKIPKTNDYCVVLDEPILELTFAGKDPRSTTVTLELNIVTAKPKET